MDSVLDPETRASVRAKAGVVATAAPPSDDVADVEDLRKAAQMLARIEVADAVSEALEQFGGSLNDLKRRSGLDPAFVSRLRTGANKQGGTVASLAQIALALGKTLKISIE